MKQQADFSKVDAILPNLLEALDKLKSSMNFPPVHVATHGAKYIRILEKRSANDEGGSAYAFLDAEGNIYKPASWKAPAKHIRGSIFDENYSIGKAFGRYGVAYLR